MLRALQNRLQPENARRSVWSFRLARIGNEPRDFVVFLRERKLGAGQSVPLETGYEPQGFCRILRCAENGEQVSVCFVESAFLPDVITVQLQGAPRSYPRKCLYG
jgi:hypothetical protein